MKLKRFQEGGIYTPFFNTGTPATKKTEEKKDLIKQEIISTLKETGLPSDVDAFLGAASKYLSSTQNIFLPSGGTDYKLSELVKLRSLANKVRHGSEMHKNAVSRLDKEGAGSEIALTNTGGLYVVDAESGNLKVITASEYHKNRDKYIPQTNAELIYKRENDISLANKNYILKDLSNTVGMKSVTEYIRQVISSFGKESTSDSSQYYTAKDRNKIQEGFEQILGMAPDGHYKVDETMSATHQGFNSKESLEAAINYLYRTLPNNMKNTLKANATLAGVDPNSVDGIKMYLQESIIEQTDHTVKRDMKLSEDSASGSSGSGGKGKMVEVSPLETIATGRVADINPITLASSKSKNGLQILAQQYPMQDKNGNIVGQGMLSDVLNTAEVGNIVDKNSITFGDHHLKDYDLNRVMYDGTSTLSRAYLPIDKAYFANTGLIKPDLNAEKRYQEFQKWMEAGYGIAPNSIITKLQELDLDLIYNQDLNKWVFRESSIKPFLILNGYASDKAVDFNNESDWMSHVNSTDGANIFDIYKRKINYGNKAITKSNKRDDFSGGFLGMGNSNSLYKSAIFMPIIDSKMAVVASNNERTPVGSYVDILNRDRLNKESQRIPTNF